MVPRSLLPPGLTPDDLDELITAGNRLRLVPSQSPRPGWLTLGWIDEGETVIFDSDAERASDSDLLIQFGPHRNPDRVLS